MVKFTRFRKRTGRIIATLVLMTAQLTPFFVFSAPKVGALETTYFLPTSTHTPNGWGTGSLGDASNGLTNNGQYAESNPENEPQQAFSNFNIVVPAGSTINGIQLQVEAKSNDNGSDCDLGAEFSWNNGANYTNTGNTQGLGSSDSMENFGGSTDTWGRSWNVDELSNTNFVVRLEAVDPNSCSNSSVTSVDYLQVKVFYSEAVVIVNNPALTQACGLDISIVLDNSQSISSAQRTQLKSAMTGLTNSFSGTPTEFSVVHFGNSASTQQTFTSNLTNVNAAINALPASPTGQYTNWEAGLAEAADNFPNRSNPNLVIFVTDGDPTASSAGPNDTNQPNVHLNPAITEANLLKSSGTRILVLGIGSPTLTRLEAISGPNDNTGNVLTSDVITTNFDQLGASLATFANQTCGGTITTTKLIDADGSNNTTNDRTPAQGWQFDINGGSNPAPVSTNAQGLTSAVQVTPGSGYSINETVQDGYEVMSAVCSGASNNGTFSGSSVTGMTINANNIVSCTFINKQGPPKLTLIKSVTNNNGGNAQPNDFNLTVGGNSVQSGVKNTYVANTPYAINETQLPGYTFTSITGHAKCPAVLGGTITMALGDDITCTITNDDVAPVLWLEKVVVNDNGGDLNADNFGIKIGNSGVVFGQPTSTNGSAKTYRSGQSLASNTNYTVSESDSNTYIEGTWSCDNGVTGSGLEVVVNMNEGDVVTCSVINDDIAPTLTLIKLVTNNNGGAEFASAWTLIAQAGANTAVISQQGAVVPDTNNEEAKTAKTNVSAGLFYTLSENGPTGYAGSNWECDGGSLVDGAIQLALATDVSCTITNDDIAPSVTITKVVENIYGGEAEVSDFTLYLGGTEVASGQSYTSFLAGQYIVSESDLEGYELTDVSGDCAWDGQIYIELNVGETSTCTLTNTQIPEPSISVEKYGPDTAHEGDTVDYYFYVTNNGNANLSNLDVSDDIAGDAVFSYYSVGDNDSILEVGETWVYTVSYEIPENQEDNVVNTVTACGNMYSDSEEDILYGRLVKADACDTDTHELDVLHPGIKVVKTGLASAPAGSTVTYTFTVTNTGDVEITDLTAVDSIAGKGVYVSGDTDEDEALDLSETWIYTVKYTIPTSQTANVVNTVKVCGYENVLELNEDVRRVLRIVDETDDAVIVEEEPTCAEDSHTLKIPQVLGSSITVKTVPKPQVLASTGVNNSVAVYLGFALILGAILSIRKTSDK